MHPTPHFSEKETDTGGPGFQLGHSGARGLHVWAPEGFHPLVSSPGPGPQLWWKRWGGGWGGQKQFRLLPRGERREWMAGAILGLPLTLLPTACHLTSPQPPGFLERGASEMSSAGSGQQEI